MSVCCTPLPFSVKRREMTKLLTLMRTYIHSDSVFSIFYPNLAAGYFSQVMKRDPEVV